MSDQNKQCKFTKSLTFRILCELAVLIFSGLIYNLIVASGDAPITEQEKEETQKYNTDVDTISIVGDHFWLGMKPSKEDMVTDEEKVVETEKARAGKDDKGKEASDRVRSNQHNVPIAAPAPDITSSSELPAKQTALSIKEIEVPKIEKIEQHKNCSLG